MSNARRISVTLTCDEVVVGASEIWTFSIRSTFALGLDPIMIVFGEREAVSALRIFSVKVGHWEQLPEEGEITVEDLARRLISRELVLHQIRPGEMVSVCVRNAGGVDVPVVVRWIGTTEIGLP